ncbi:cytochrome b561 and DOMON domain-containing protein At3g25290-like [Aristolochia californica]|uniref:cytochrome b561 and DOMON domain-containing protein At3g25290-like n=1 Tax=Aristolochia californica TaxID=171875 RepID=UPI0035DD25A7
MASSSRLCLLFLLLLLLCSSPLLVTSACTSQTFSRNRVYSLCSDLPTLSSSLHWTFDAARSFLSLAFVAPPAHPKGWIAWAVNPSGPSMIGSQALIAFKQPNGSMAVKTFNVSSYGPITPSPIDYRVSDMQAEFVGGMMMIFATLALPKGTIHINQVWQVGSAVDGSVPQKHDLSPANLAAKGTLDLMKGQTIGGTTAGDSRLKKKNIHGILNTVSWGILMPIGAIIARHLRTFKFADPAWFYLHVSCQFSGYVVGVAGWATGLKLGHESKGVRYDTHRNLGIALFCFSTLQVFALLLRPKKDHKWRVYWNIYHHSVGYSVIVMSIINVFKGLAILEPGNKWRIAYIIVLVVLGAIAAILEVLTWVVLLKRRKSDTTTKLHNGSNGARV